MEHLSASSIAQFIQCPEQFRLRRLQRVPESTGIDKWIGIIDHETHAVNLTRKITEHEDLDHTAMRKVYDETWDTEFDEVVEKEGVPEWAKDEVQVGETKEHGQLIMHTYHDLVSPTVHPIAVETRFEEQLPGVPVKLVGYVDVEEEARLIERKTTKARMSKPKPGWLLQGRLYSMVFQKPVEWQVVTRAKTPTVCLPDTDPELRLEVGGGDGVVLLIQQAAYMLNDLFVRYGPDSPWPTTGILHPFLCGYCFAGPKYNFKCAAWKE